MTQFRSKALVAGGGVLALDRRLFIGGMALGVGVAAGRGLASVAKAAPGPAASASVFMDMPFVGHAGVHKSYEPPKVVHPVVEHGPEHFMFA